MRTIEFRAIVRDEYERKKLTDYGFIYGDFQYFGKDKSYIDGYKWRLRIIGETLGQYTGRNDRFHVKVFEGDIVTFTDYRNTENGQDEFVNTGIIKWDNEQARFYIEGAYQEYDFAMSDDEYNGLTIIGTIHDEYRLGVRKGKQ